METTLWTATLTSGNASRFYETSGIPTTYTDMYLSLVYAFFKKNLNYAVHRLNPQTRWGLLIKQQELIMWHTGELGMKREEETIFCLK